MQRSGNEARKPQPGGGDGGKSGKPNGPKPEPGAST
jgi:hypothetical protein